MTKATVKEWFEKKLINEGVILTVGATYAFEIFAVIKESEKAVYAMCFVGCKGDYACKKTIWIPKSVIENLDSVQRIANYEEAAQAFDINH